MPVDSLRMTTLAPARTAPLGVGEGSGDDTGIHLGEGHGDADQQVDSERFHLFGILSEPVWYYNRESFPIQNDPEEGGCFQYRTILNIQL